MGQYLPDPIVRHIHNILASDEPPGARPLYLLRMCGVSKSWREFCSEIKPELLLDGLSGVGPGASKGTLMAFRKQTLQLKRAAFEGAAAVLQGYSRVELLGECVSDEVLFRLAARNGGRLTHVKLKNTSSVSDRGLAAVIRAAPQLQELDLEQMGASFQGTCLPLLLASCPRLTLIRIEGAPGINWHSLRPYWWPISRHTAPAQQQQDEEEEMVAVAASPDQQAAPAMPAPPASHQQQQEVASASTDPSMQATAASSSAAPILSGAQGDDEEGTLQVGRQPSGCSHLVCSGVTGAITMGEELVGSASQDDLLAHDPAHSRSISAANLAAGLGNSAALSSLQAAAAAVAAAAAAAASGHVSSGSASTADIADGAVAGQQQQQQAGSVGLQGQQVALPRLHQSTSQQHRQPQQQQAAAVAGHGQEETDSQADSDMPDSLSEDLQSCCTISSQGAEASGSRAAAGSSRQQPAHSSSAPRPAEQQQQEAAAAGAAGVGRGAGLGVCQQPASDDKHHPQQQQKQQQQQQHTPEQLRAPVSSLALRPHPPHAALKHLHIRFANLGAPPPPQAQQQQQQGAGAGGGVCALRDLLARAPGVEALVLDGPSANLELAATLCGGLGRVGYLVTSGEALDAALWPLSMMPSLRELLLEVAGFLVGAEHLKVLGMLPLTELGLDSHAARQAPDMPPRAYSQVDNEGVKALVDAICMRMRMRGEVTPFKLSLCGATALKQEAVSALLRLPVLTGVDTSGCSKLSPMDRMRLVAKVKAGQGLLEGKGAASGGSGGAGNGAGLQFQGVFY